MKPKFEGPDGRRRLTEALKAFRLVEHDENLARRLAAEGELLEISEGTTIIEQKTLTIACTFLSLEKSMFLLMAGMCHPLRPRNNRRNGFD